MPRRLGKFEGLTYSSAKAAFGGDVWGCSIVPSAGSFNWIYSSCGFLTIASDFNELRPFPKWAEITPDHAKSELLLTFYKMI
jgi:hypothetical protein